MTVPFRDVLIVVSEDVLLVRTLTQRLQGRAELVAASNSALARAADPQRVRGVIIDGAQLKQPVVGEVARLRETYPLAHLLLLTNPTQLPLINELQPLRVELLVRPLPVLSLHHFVERALSAGRLSKRSLRAWIDEMASECRLTRRDLALMPRILEEESVEATCARLGVDEVTLQRLLRRLVKKCGVRNTDRLAKNLMRDALLFSRHATAGFIEPLSVRAASF